MKRTVEVTYLVEVETDDSKFDLIFMRDFRKYFRPFMSIEKHACYIARLAV